MNSASSASRHPSAELRVSWFDRISAALTAAVVLAGLVVTWMFFVWLAMLAEEYFAWSVPNPVKGGAMVLNDSDGFKFDSDLLGAGELPEAKQAGIAVALQATTEAVSRVQAADPSTFVGDGAMGSGTGEDPRLPGGEKQGDGVNPLGGGPATRWVIEHEASNRREYLEKLAGFDIAIGVVHTNSNRIQSLEGYATGDYRVTEGRRRDETRIFFLNQRNRLARWDRLTVESAGLGTDDVIIGHFLPSTLQATLEALERAAAAEAGYDPALVQKTTFCIDVSTGPPRFKVAAIEFGKPRSVVNGDSTL